MAERRVMQSKKDLNGDILSICNHGEHWSPKSKDDAISEIENNIHSYYVVVGRERVEIKIVEGSMGKYLRTDPDKTTRNNLDDLPDC